MKYNPLLHGTARQWDEQRKPHKGGGGGGTSTTTPTIPDELKPLANLYTQQATQYAQTPFQAYTGQRFADLNQTQNAGLNMVQQRALGGSATMNNAESNLNQLITGGPNPYLDSMFNQAADQMQNRVDSNMALAGRLGSNAHGEAFSRGLAQAATNIYGQGYESDQARRLQAIGQAPTFGNAMYQDAGQLINAGNIQQQAAQNPLDFAYSQFKEAQDYPLKQMSATGGMLGQNMGSTTTSKQSSGGK